MTQLFVLNDCQVRVDFQEHSVHIYNDNNLWQLIGHNPQLVTPQLVAFILEQYHLYYGRSFSVHPDSLTVEIWGHVYFEYFALVSEKLIQLKLVGKLTTKLISYCEIIDCGEDGYDDNRGLWDSLAPFIGLIAGWLPENIQFKNLKK
jgi:hypothetical protein